MMRKITYYFHPNFIFHWSVPLKFTPPPFISRTSPLPIFFLAPLTTPQPVKTGLEEYCQMFSKSSTSFYEHPSARCFYEDFQRQVSRDGAYLIVHVIHVIIRAVN